MNLIPCPLQNNAREFGDLPALKFNGQKLNYQELHEAVTSMSLRLRSLGIKPGDRVAVLAPNSNQYIILLYALWRIKAVSCLLNTHLPEEQIIWHLKTIRANALLTASTEIPHFSTLAMKTFSFTNIFSQEQSAPDAYINQPYTFSLDQNLSIIFTSGSSDEPKAVLHSFGNHYFSAQGVNEHLKLKPKDRWLVALPLYHVGGLSIFFRMLLARGQTVLLKEKEGIESAIPRNKITHTSLVPTQLYRVLQSKKLDTVVKSLKAVLVGGAGVPEELVKSAIKAGIPIFVTYGLTEMSSSVAVSTQLSKADQDLKGKLLSEREVKISDDGEIFVKGKPLFQGYVAYDTVTRPVTKEGWFQTGDLGHLTKDNYLRVYGRTDNMFISGGENIQPEEVEKYMHKIDGIEDVAVVPIPHEEFGFRPIAFIKKEGANDLSKKMIIRHLERHLPKFKIPDQIYQWPDIDDVSLKTNRKNLSELALEKNSKLSAIK